MEKKITCFIPYNPSETFTRTVADLRNCRMVDRIYGLSTLPQAHPVDGCDLLTIASFYETATFRLMAVCSETSYILLYTKDTPIDIGMYALERMVAVADDTRAGFLYADHYSLTAGGVRKQHPVIDYQQGSLRDDFDFGALMLFDSTVFKEAVAAMDAEYRFAGFYDLRLRMSERTEIVHINEYLYTISEQDARTSGEKLFDYVNPKNREVQIEMETACTEYLKRIGGYLSPTFASISFDEVPFDTEATVIIPVRNRVRTIEDAICSVLEQQTTFSYNLIIVDNHSTDGTTDLIRKYAKENPRVLHLIPEREDLGIGGCWNMGVHHPLCGKFVVQLDSDDVYSGPDTLQKIVDAFYTQRCAMVVGTYRMTDFNMNEIPPGVIDHKEWTPENGRNNALRINGLGAPRAFYTPVLRRIKLPNTSYGEDYALGLRISRMWQIGRIYEVLYLCRRWEDNSDAALDVVKMNGHNLYKDRIRTWELQARIALVAKR